MVRAVADRGFLPAKSLFEQVGNMMILTGKTLTAVVKPPYPYGGEFTSQFLFALQLTWFPMTISTIAFGFGAPGLQAANFLTLFGALDRLGGFFVLASIREFAPFVTGVEISAYRVSLKRGRRVPAVKTSTSPLRLLLCIVISRSPGVPVKA